MDDGCKEGRIIYLMMHRTHLYLQLYGVEHVIKDHSDSENGNPLLPHYGLLFLISSKVSFICTIHTGLTKAVVCNILSVGWCI